MLTYLFTGDSWSAVTTERGLNILIDEETEKFHEDCETLRKETVEVFVKLRENPALAAVIVPDLTLEWTGQRLRALGENLLIEGAAIDFGCNAPIYIRGVLESWRYLSHGRHLLRQAAIGNGAEALLTLTSNAISEQFIRRFMAESSEPNNDGLAQTAMFALGWFLAYRCLERHPSLANSKWRADFRKLRGRILALRNPYSISMAQHLIVAFTGPTVERKSFMPVDKEILVVNGFRRLKDYGAFKPPSLNAHAVQDHPQELVDDVCDALHLAKLWDNQLLEYIELCPPFVEPESRFGVPQSIEEQERAANHARRREMEHHKELKVLDTNLEELFEGIGEVTDAEIDEDFDSGDCAWPDVAADAGFDEKPDEKADENSGAVNATLEEDFEVVEIEAEPDEDVEVELDAASEPAAPDPSDAPMASPAPRNVASGVAAVVAAAVPLLAAPERFQIELPLNDLAHGRNPLRYPVIIAGLVAAGAAAGFVGLAINFFVTTSASNKRALALKEQEHEREQERAQEMEIMLADRAVFNQFVNETGEIIRKDLRGMAAIEAGPLIELEEVEEMPETRDKRAAGDEGAPPAQIQNIDVIVPQARVLNVSAILPDFSDAPEKREFVWHVLRDIDPADFVKAFETPAELRIDTDPVLFNAGMAKAEELHDDDPDCSGDSVRIAREHFGKPIEYVLSPAMLLNRDESEVRGEIAELLVAGRAYMALCESAPSSKQYFSILLPEPTIPAELLVPDPEAALAQWDGIVKPGDLVSTAISSLVDRFKGRAQQIYGNQRSRRIDIAEIEKIFESLRSDLEAESARRRSSPDRQESDARQIAQIALHIFPSFEKRTLEYFRVLNKVRVDLRQMHPVSPEYDLYAALVYGVRYAVARTMPQVSPLFQSVSRDMVLLQVDLAGDETYKQVQGFAQSMLYALLDGGGWAKALNMSMQPKKLADEFASAFENSDFRRRMSPHALEGLKKLSEFETEEKVGSGPAARIKYYEQFNGWRDKYLEAASKALTVTRLDSIDASPFWIHEPTTTTYCVTIVLGLRAFGRRTYFEKKRTVYWSKLSDDRYMIIETDNTIPEVRVVSRDETQCDEALFKKFFIEQTEYKFRDYFRVTTPEHKEVAECIEKLFKISHIQWGNDRADLRISTEKTGAQVVQQLDILCTDGLKTFVKNLKESMRAKYWYTPINGAIPFYDLAVRLSEDRYYETGAVRIAEEVVNLVLLVADPAVQAGKALGVAAESGFHILLEGYFAEQAVGKLAVRIGEEVVPNLAEGLIKAGQELSSNIVIGLLMPPLGPLALPLQIYGLVNLGRRAFQAARSFRYFQPVSISGRASPLTAQLVEKGYVKFVKEWPMPWKAPKLKLHEYEITPLGATVLRLQGGQGPDVNEGELGESWAASLNGVVDFSVALTDAALPELESQPAWLERSMERDGKLLQLLDGSDAISYPDDSNIMLTATVLKLNRAEDGFVHATVDLTRLDVADSIVLDAQIGERQLLLTAVSEDERRLEVFYFSRFDVEPWSLKYADAMLGAWNTKYPGSALNPSLREQSPQQLIASMGLSQSNLIFGNRWNGRQFDWMTAVPDAPASQQMLLRAGSSLDAQSGHYVDSRIDCRMTALRTGDVVNVRTATSKVHQRSIQRISAPVAAAKQGSVFHVAETSNMVDILRGVKLETHPKALIDAVTNAMKDKFGEDGVVVEPQVLSKKSGSLTTRSLLFQIRQNGDVFMAGWADETSSEPFCLAEQSWFEKARRENEGTTSVLSAVNSQNWAKSFSTPIEALLQSADAQVLSIDVQALEFSEPVRLDSGVKPIEKSPEIDMRVERSVGDIDDIVEHYLHERAPADLIKGLDDLRDHIQPSAVRVTTVVRLAYSAETMHAPSCSVALHVTLKNGADFVVPGQPAAEPVVFSGVRVWASRGADLILTFEQDAPVASFSAILNEDRAGMKFFDGAYWKRADSRYEIQYFNPKLKGFLLEQLDQSRAELDLPWRDVLNSGVRPQSYFESRAYRILQLKERVFDYPDEAPMRERASAQDLETRRASESPNSKLERYAVKVKPFLAWNEQARVQEINADGSLTDRPDIEVDRLPSSKLLVDFNEASRILEHYRQIYQDIEGQAQVFGGDTGNEVVELAEMALSNLDAIQKSVEAKASEEAIHAIGSSSPGSVDAAKQNLFGFCAFARPAAKNVLVGRAMVIHPFVALREHPSFLFYYQTRKRTDLTDDFHLFNLQSVETKLVADAVSALKEDNKADLVLFEIANPGLNARARASGFEKISGAEFDDIKASGERWGKRKKSLEEENAGSSRAAQLPVFVDFPNSRVLAGWSDREIFPPALINHVASLQYDNGLLTRNFIYGVGTGDFVDLSGRSKQTLALFKGVSTEDYIRQVLRVLKSKESVARAPFGTVFRSFTFPAGHEPAIKVGDVMQNHGLMAFSKSVQSVLPERGKVEILYVLQQDAPGGLRKFPKLEPVFSLPGDLFQVTGIKREARNDGGVKLSVAIEPAGSDRRVWTKSLTGETIEVADSIEPLGTFESGRFDALTERDVKRALDLIGEKDLELRGYRDRPKLKCDKAAERFGALYKHGFLSIIQKLEGPEELALKDTLQKMANSRIKFRFMQLAQKPTKDEPFNMGADHYVILLEYPRPDGQSIPVRMVADYTAGQFAGRFKIDEAIFDYEDNWAERYMAGAKRRLGEDLIVFEDFGTFFKANGAGRRGRIDRTPTLKNGLRMTAPQWYSDIPYKITVPPAKPGRRAEIEGGYFAALELIEKLSLDPVSSLLLYDEHYDARASDRTLDEILVASYRTGVEAKASVEPNVSLQAIRVKQPVSEVFANNFMKLAIERFSSVVPVGKDAIEQFASTEFLEKVESLPAEMHHVFMIDIGNLEHKFIFVLPSGLVEEGKEGQEGKPAGLVLQSDLGDGILPELAIDDWIGSGSALKKVAVEDIDQLMKLQGPVLSRQDQFLISRVLSDSNPYRLQKLEIDTGKPASFSFQRFYPGNLVRNLQILEPQLVESGSKVEPGKMDPAWSVGEQLPTGGRVISRQEWLDSEASGNPAEFFQLPGSTPFYIQEGRFYYRVMFSESNSLFLVNPSAVNAETAFYKLFNLKKEWQVVKDRSAWIDKDY